MSSKQQIIQILSLPEVFYEPGNNKSFKKLLEETEYLKISEQIDEKDFLEAMKENPKFITTWINWSDNKRSASGWFIKENENNEYVVSFFPQKDGIKNFKTNDIKMACAFFIKMELESLII